MSESFTDDKLASLLRPGAGTGPAIPLDDHAANALIGRALDSVLGPVGGGGGAAAGAGAAAVVAARGGKLWLGAGAALAAAVGGWLLLRSPNESAPTAIATPPIAAPAPAPIAPGPPPTLPPAPAEPTEIALPPETLEPRPARPDHVATPPPARAEDLLAEASAARGRREWRAADALYGRVVDEHRGSQAAQVALVASANLHLEHLSDPGGAARRFRAALASGSKTSIAEEARYGVAEAERALGHHSAEAAALAEFLQHHPNSPLAERARTRQAELTEIRERDTP